MTRVVFGELLFFLLPFAVFALYLLILRRNPLLFEHWSRSSLWLAMAGLACVILAFVVAGIRAERNTGAFEPTHMEDGRVVPGQFRR
jgi:heme/copper-type cytochrome/quinol oxidase subunit 1